MKKLIIRSWFISLLVIALVFGYVLADQCRALVDMSWLKWGIVVVTMFVMALPISFGSIKATLSNPKVPGLAIFLNAICLPLLAWPFSKLVEGDLGLGLIVAGAAPCTLASAAVWTRRAGGNAAVAIVVTIFTNAFCFLIMPFWILVLIGQSAEVDFLATTGKLFFLVVLPMVIGQLCRANAHLAKWSDSQKVRLGVVAQLGVLSIVFIGSAATAIRLADAEAAMPVHFIALTIFCVTAMHLIVLVTGLWTARKAGFAHEDQIAVAFSGSQKTLMVGLSTAMDLGVSIIPIVAFHSVQLLLDTFIADRWKK